MEKTLQDQLTEVETLLEQEKAKGTQKDADVIARLEQQQADLLLQMDAEKAKAEQEAAQQVRIQTQEEKVESEPIPIAVAGVDLSQLDPELIQLMELVTKADRRARLVEFNAEIEAIQNDHKEQLRQAREEIQKRGEASLLDATKIAELEKEVKDIRNMYEESQKQVHTLEFNVSHAEQTRDNAANELAGLQDAYKALQEEIQQMRLANVFGEKKAQKIIDITPEETNKAQNLVDSLAKKFVSATPISANWHEVVDEAGNKTVVHTNELQKLEEVQPFRPSELDQGNVESSTDIAAVTVPGVAEVTTFPTTFPVQSGDAMDSGISSEDGSQAETVAETWDNERLTTFLLRHEKRLNNLENQVYRKGEKISDSIPA